MEDSSRLQSLLDDVARLVDQEGALTTFARDTAQLLVTQCHFAWVGLWVAATSATAEVLLADAGIQNLGEETVLHLPERVLARSGAIRQRATHGFTWTTQGSSALDLPSTARTLQSCHSLLVPVPNREGPTHVWEFVAGLDCGPGDLHSLQPALEAIASLTAGRLREERVVELQHGQQELRRWLALITTAIRNPDGQQPLNMLAEEIVTAVDCDRAWIVELWGESVAALAVSSAPRVERRGELVRGLERLVDAAVRARRAGGPSASEVELLDLVDPAVRQLYLDLSGGRELYLVPLPVDPANPQGELAGVVVCENFQRCLVQPRRGMELLQRCGASLLQEVQRSHRPTWKRLANLERAAWSQVWHRQRARWWGVAALTLLCPVPFRIHAQGVLQPVDQVRLFAPEDAVVTEVHVEHGQAVAAGQLLLRLRSSRLDLEQQRIEGELRAARERLAGIESSRLGGEGLADRNSPGGAAALAGEEAGLREQVTSLLRQSQSISAQALTLQIRPDEDGRVLTWDPVPRLMARPVQRGQLLLELGSGAEGWRLDLWVTGREARHLPRQIMGRENSVEFWFRRLSVPGFQGKATLHSVAAAMDQDPQGEPQVRVDARVETEDTFRPGEPVTARIGCGLRPLIYVLVPDLFDSCRRWFPW